MIDIHSHIIPGLDDGSDNMEDSLEMIRLAQSSGTLAMVATPHCNIEGHTEEYSLNMLADGLNTLNRRIAEAGYQVEVMPGMEIYASEDIAEKIVEGKLISLNGSRYYLIEFPFDTSTGWVDYILERMQEVKGVVPVIAHPERYFCVQAHPEITYNWIRRGCLTQINKASLAGKFGHMAFQACMDMAEHNLIACVGSDAHTPYSRTPHMIQAWEFLKQEYSSAYAQLLLVNNPQKIVRNIRVEMRGTAREIGKKHFWRE